VMLTRQEHHSCTCCIHGHWITAAFSPVALSLLLLLPPPAAGPRPAPVPSTS
jgi:hypothetical protein